jgi:excisionase family DNA binding protein
MLNPNLPVAALTQAEFQDMLRGFIEQFPSSQPNPTITETKLLSVAEMCALAKISRGTLYTARKEGRIPFKRIGKRILFSPSEVLEALKQG